MRENSLLEFHNLTPGQQWKSPDRAHAPRAHGYEDEVKRDCQTYCRMTKRKRNKLELKTLHFCRDNFHFNNWAWEGWRGKGRVAFSHPAAGPLRREWRRADDLSAATLRRHGKDLLQFLILPFPPSPRSSLSPFGTTSYTFPRHLAPRLTSSAPPPTLPPVTFPLTSPPLTPTLHLPPSPFFSLHLPLPTHLPISPPSSKGVTAECPPLSARPSNWLTHSNWEIITVALHLLPPTCLHVTVMQFVCSTLLGWRSTKPPPPIWWW